MMGYGPGYGHGYGYGYGNMMGGGFGGLLVFLFGALLIAGVVLLVLWAVRASHGQGHSAAQGVGTLPPAAAGHDEAVAIAKRRLASGELTPEQYSEIMRTLGS
jgi:putative membrane protein